MIQDVNISVYNMPWEDRIYVNVFKKNGNEVLRMSSIKWVNHDIGKASEPIISIGRHEAQKIMNNLWSMGIRPDEINEEPSALKATKNHLEDMRKIVFDYLKEY